VGPRHDEAQYATARYDICYTNIAIVVSILAGIVALAFAPAPAITARRHVRTL
jgi:hypothetical protein